MCIAHPRARRDSGNPVERPKTEDSVLIFPIGDDNSARTSTPVVNYLLIAVNILVFVFLQGFGNNENFNNAFSVVPEEIVTGRDVVRNVTIHAGDQTANFELQPTPVSVYLTLLTSMFMHASVMHILGNMLFLWIFGDNIENALGGLRYLIFYLLCGIIASLSQVFATVMFGGNPYIPSLGASGAIAGVLGAYILLFPRNQVRVFLIRFLTTVPAVVAIGLWFLLQVVEGYFSGPASGGGGVAYAAHVGGFIAGLVLIKIFAIGRNSNSLSTG
jgi:membrane associated rhomboid family serine protease